MNNTIKRLEIKLRRMERQRDGLKRKGKENLELAKKCEDLRRQVNQMKLNIEVSREMGKYNGYSLLSNMGRYL